MPELPPVQRYWRACRTGRQSGRHAVSRAGPARQPLGAKPAPPMLTTRPSNRPASPWARPAPPMLTTRPSHDGDGGGEGSGASRRVNPPEEALRFPFVAGTFPVSRPRRLRTSAALRHLVAETRLDVGGLVAPLFVREDIDEPQPIRLAARRCSAQSGQRPRRGEGVGGSGHRRCHPVRRSFVQGLDRLAGLRPEGNRPALPVATLPTTSATGWF